MTKKCAWCGEEADLRGHQLYHSRCRSPARRERTRIRQLRIRVKRANLRRVRRNRKSLEDQHHCCACRRIFQQVGRLTPVPEVYLIGRIPLCRGCWRRFFRVGVLRKTAEASRLTPREAAFAQRVGWLPV